MARVKDRIKEYTQENPHSMTGYGRSTVASKRASVSIEVKSLNCKYLEIRPKIPRIFASWDPIMRNCVSKMIRRGTVEVLVGYQILDPDMINPINEATLQAYAKGIEEVSEHLNIPSGLNLTSILRLPGALAMEDVTGLGDAERAELFHLLDEALNNAIVEMLIMRADEGKALITVLEREVTAVSELTKKIRGKVPVINERLKKRLKDRMENSIRGNKVNIDESRFLQELAYYTDRSDVTEELDRLESHSRQFLDILQGGKELVIGKRLDFLIQEMLRETNTIGSKSDDLEVTNHVVDLKLAIDRLREQIQNLE